MKEKFRFKQFSVSHHRASMKVGTDAVLIGAWSEVAHARRILDIGTGCGVIALMMAQRTTDATIDAIDVHPDSVAEAAENFLLSPWRQRLHAIQADANQYQAEPYDLIVTNPPFFTNGVLAPEAARRDARHTIALTYNQLAAAGARLLTDEGAIALIVPAEALEAVEAAMRHHDLHPAHRCFVATTPAKAPKRVMATYARHVTAAPTDDNLVIANPDGSFTDEYRDLTGDFYL